MGLVCFPASALILAAAHPLVMVLLGPKWEGAVSVFAGFTAAGLYLPLALASTWLFTSQGRSGELLKTNGILSAITILAFLIGLPYGAMGMALAFSLSGLFVRLPLLYYWVGRRGPVRTPDLWRVFLLHLPSALTVYAAAAGACAVTKDHGSIIQLLTAGVMSAIVAVATICVSSRRRQIASHLAISVKASLLKRWRPQQVFKTDFSQECHDPERNHQ
jgi:PST family polysaccharide transporter